MILILRTPISKGIVGALFAFFALFGLSNTLSGKCTINVFVCVLLVLVLSGFAYWLLHSAYTQYRNLQRRAGEPRG